MDCRWTFCVAAALLSSAAGCVHSSLLPDPDPVAKATEEKEKDKDAKSVWVLQTKLKPETLVSYGDLKATSAIQPETAPGDRERYLEQARESYEKALKEDPNFVPAHLALARLLASTNNHPAALVSLQKSPGAAPEGQGCLGRGEHVPRPRPGMGRGRRMRAESARAGPGQPAV